MDWLYQWMRMQTKFNKAMLHKICSTDLKEKNQIIHKLYWGHVLLEWIDFYKILQLFSIQMPKPLYTFPSTFPFKHMNCTIFYVSSSSNIKTIWHEALLYPLWVQIYGDYWYFMKRNHILCVATLTWPSVGVKPNTWKSWGFGVLRDSRIFRARQQDSKHLALRCSWCHWKGLEA